MSSSVRQYTALMQAAKVHFNPVPRLFTSLIVGLDIQQKFTVYYSGARRFGACDNPNDTLYSAATQRQQLPAPKPQPADQATPPRGNATCTTDQGTALLLCYVEL